MMHRLLAMQKHLPRVGPADLSIGQRLATGFAILLLLLLISAGLGVRGMTTLNRSAQDLTEQQLPTLLDANAWIIGLLETSRHMQNVAMLNDHAAVTRELGEVHKNKAERKTLKQKLEKALVDAAGAKALEDVMDARARYLPSEDQFIQLAESGDLAAARALLLSETLPIQRDYIDQLYRLIDAGKNAVNAQRDASASAYVQARSQTLALSAAAALCAVLIGFLITRSITRPLGRVVEVADRIASGRLDSVIEIGRHDETGRLLESMQAMQTSLNGFVAAQADMARQHAAGAVDFRMAADAYPGVFGEMATAVNELVAAQLTVTSRMSEVIAAYAIGNFAVDMPPLPGLQMQLTQTCAGAKSNLLGLQAQIVRLTAAAARGDFAVRGEPERFHNSFREMVQHLNHMMAVCDASLSDVSRVVAAIAEGNLTERIVEHYDGTFGQLKEATNRTAGQLQEVVHEIRTATLAMSAAVTDIAQGTTDLASRTERQATSTQEAARAMALQTDMVQRNAANAQHASELVRGTADVASEGGEAVGKVVRTMADIAGSSRKISEIIGVINAIAFQTNILALNAAVEAARAGELGRGFAVVAGEVRSLATRSAEAAKQIEHLIADSARKVESGSREVAAAGGTMQAIVQSVSRVTEIMTAISAASNEQASGIAQVGGNIAEIRDATQRNAELVEASGAAARAMEALAGRLSRSVSVFELGGH